MTSKFYDLKITKLDDGTISLEQAVDYEDNAVIYLHPLQAAHIADGVPVSAPHVRKMSAYDADRIATLERRLCWMRDRFDVCHLALPSDIYERCPDAFEFDAWLMASKAVATEYCSDLTTGQRTSPVTEFCAGFPNVPSNAPSNALASPLEAPSLPSGDGCLPSAAECAGERPEHGNADLFAVLETAGA